MIPYFAYDINSEKIQEITKGAAPLAEATLFDWEVAFTGEGLATLRAREGSRTEGFLYRFRESDWLDIDNYLKELAPYQRLPLKVAYWGESIQAESYYLGEEDDS